MVRGTRLTTTKEEDRLEVIWLKLIESRERGEDITEDALSKLLPYIDYASQPKKRIWVSSAGYL
jgi:hypothetical protein